LQSARHRAAIAFASSQPKSLLNKSRESGVWSLESKASSFFRLQTPDSRPQTLPAELIIKARCCGYQRNYFKMDLTNEAFALLAVLLRPEIICLHREQSGPSISARATTRADRPHDKDRNRYSRHSACD
jgi:hypothetical protein